MCPDWESPRDPLVLRLVLSLSTTFIFKPPAFGLCFKGEVAELWKLKPKLVTSLCDLCSPCRGDSGQTSPCPVPATPPWEDSQALWAVAPGRGVGSPLLGAEDQEPFYGCILGGVLGTAAVSRRVTPAGGAGAGHGERVGSSQG